MSFQTTETGFDPRIVFLNDFWRQKMRVSKVVLLVAALLAVVFVASVFAAPMFELQDKDWYWLEKDKADKAIGFVAESHTKVQHDGEDCLKSVRTVFSGGATWTYEWIRGLKQPLYSMTVKKNGAVITTGKNVPGGYELTINGKAVSITKDKFDYFANDDQNIYSSLEPGETKELKLFDVATGEIVKKTFASKGEEEMELHGQKIQALKFDVVEGTTAWTVKVAKGTRALLVSNNNIDGSKIKRVKKPEINAAFPGKI